MKIELRRGYLMCRYSQKNRDRYLLYNISAIGVAIGTAFAFAFLFPDITAVDFKGAFLPAAHEDLQNFYNPYWIRPVFELLAQIKYPFSYFIFMSLNILAVILAACILRNYIFLILLTYQFFYLLFYGQLEGFVVLGLSLEWLAIQKRRPMWFGLGALLALLKPHISLIPSIVLWWWLGRWRLRLQSLFPIIGVVTWTIRLYGWWPLEWVMHIINAPPNAAGNISLWAIVGPAAFILWIPLKLGTTLPKFDFLRWVLSTAALTMPYFQHYSLITLQILIPNPIIWIGNVAFLFYFFDITAQRMTVILPVTVYICCIYKLLKTKNKYI